MDKNIVFIGGKQIGANCLKILLKKGIVPKLVIGNFDDAGKDTWHESVVRIALENSIPTVKKKRVRGRLIIKSVQKLNPEIIFCIGGTQIIPPRLLRIPKLGCLNIHPALLPKYRGRFSTVHALFNKEKYTGVTLHWMNEEMDAGPIIMQKKIKIDKSDTAKSLYKKFTILGTQLFEIFLKIWLAGKAFRTKPQNEDLATSFPKVLPNQGRIDWSWDGQKILRFIRALTFEPFPPVEFKIGEKEMVIVDKKYFKGYKYYLTKL